LAKYKEAIQLWDHGLKESKQKLAWGIDDLDRYLRENDDHPDVTHILKTTVKEVISKGKTQLREHRMDSFTNMR
jgi:hypothetical protein